MLSFIQLRESQELYGWVKPDGKFVIANNREYHDSIGSGTWFATGAAKFRIKKKTLYLTISDHPKSAEHAKDIVNRYNDDFVETKATVVAKKNPMRVLDNGHFLDDVSLIRWLNQRAK